MHIVSKDNPKIKLYLKLSGSKKTRQDMGLFVLEGARLCGDAIKEWQAGRLEIHTVFASKSALEKYKDYIDSHLFEDEKSDVFFTVDEKLCQKISDTKAAQGVYVIAKMNDNNLTENSINSNGKYLILNNLQDPGNLGTLLRTADAVGLNGVVLSNNCCDLYNPKTLRSAMGSIFRIKTFSCNDFAETVQMFRNKGVKTWASVVDKNVTSLINADFSAGSAVVVGNEGNGISKEHAGLCDERVTIRMQGNINSLNAAMAGAIILWEMTRNGDSNDR